MDALGEFQAHRGLLFALAYRMLGSVADAEDVLQDAYLRYEAVPSDTIRSPKAFLSTLVTRLCLNHLESARARRETYVGPWLPEPVRTDRPELAPAVAPPSQRIEMLESISMAFLVTLEQLSPAERAVFLLHEVFDFPYDDVAEMVGKDAAACRQLGSRAAKHIAAHRPRFRSRHLLREQRARGGGRIRDGHRPRPGADGAGRVPAGGDRLLGDAGAVRARRPRTRDRGAPQDL